MGLSLFLLALQVPATPAAPLPVDGEYDLKTRLEIGKPIRYSYSFKQGAPALSMTILIDEEAVGTEEGRTRVKRTYGKVTSNGDNAMLKELSKVTGKSDLYLTSPKGEFEIANNQMEVGFPRLYLPDGKVHPGDTWDPGPDFIGNKAKLFGAVKVNGRDAYRIEFVPIEGATDNSILGPGSSWTIDAKDGRPLAITMKVKAGANNNAQFDLKRL